MANFIKLVPRRNQYTDGRPDDRLLMVSSVQDSASDQAAAVEALNALGLSGGGGGTLGEVLTLLGIPTFANLAAANASGTIDIGKPFYNTATSKLDITTA